MNDSPNLPDTPEELPQAKEAKSRWRFPVVWVVPVIAAIVAAYLVYDRVHEYGPKITIRFKDASGLKAGITQITYRGVGINVESFRALAWAPKIPIPQH
jgi:paraquat-inducible protein B